MHQRQKKNLFDTFQRIAIYNLCEKTAEKSQLLYWANNAQKKGATAFMLRVPLGAIINENSLQATSVWLKEEFSPINLLLNIAFFSANFVKFPIDGLHLKANQNAEVIKKDYMQEVPQLILGKSCHSFAEIKSAESYCDYVTLSPIFSTPTHAEVMPLGLEALAGSCTQAAVPVVALGGIDLENEKLCRAVGAAGIAAIRLFT